MRAYTEEWRLLRSEKDHAVRTMKEFRTAERDFYDFMRHNPPRIYKVWNAASRSLNPLVRYVIAYSANEALKVLHERYPGTRRMAGMNVEHIRDCPNTTSSALRLRPCLVDRKLVEAA